MDELSHRYVRNLNDDGTYLAFSGSELAGLSAEFLKIIDKAESGKYKIQMRSHHVAVVLEFCKIGATRRSVAMTYVGRCSEVNLSVLEALVELRHKYADCLDIQIMRTTLLIVEWQRHLQRWYRLQCFCLQFT